ncbi:YeiH family protein [Pelistega europaea]|uniref:YeiH family putative sulfate export transporter n=1 Tax=Pelistega europaea TaxID=106147 RepID=A0A7Y4L9P4_9BURK|nr:YeiH family protein [Pelistega europaea]NOL49570.1 YeiH family putative sulfate export transporter [Pelistega europaea]
MLALFPGLLVTGLVVVLGLLLEHFGVGANLGLSAISFAILIGMIFGNTFYPKIAAKCDKGVLFSKGTLLRTGIIFYGFRLTLNQLVELGWSVIIIDAFVVASTFLLTYFIGRRLLKMDENTVILTGAGCSICGAAAVMATSSVVKAKPSEVTQAIAVVVLFGTLAIFIYPWLYHVLFTPDKAVDFGIGVGASVHEVAQVVAVGRQIGDAAMDMAVITKMVRVMMLAPFLFILMLFLLREQEEGGRKQKITIPWFAVWFLVMIVVNSVLPIPDEVRNIIVRLDQIVLTMAMAALGLTTHFSAFKTAGYKAIVLGAVIFVWLIVIGCSIPLLL